LFLSFVDIYLDGLRIYTKKFFAVAVLDEETYHPLVLVCLAWLGDVYIPIRSCPIHNRQDTYQYMHARDARSNDIVVDFFLFFKKKEHRSGPS